MPRDYPNILVPPPGPKAQEIVRRDEEWTQPCYIKEYPLVISRGAGAMVEDVDGNRYLDFMAGIAVSSTGYGHPKVVAAVKEAADRFLHICGSDFYFEGMAALCERLGRLAPGKSKKRVFLTNSGTEAVEAAIKLARYATRRTAMIAFHGSFHGRTSGAITLTSSKARQHAGFGPLLPDVHHVPFPNRYRCQLLRRQARVHPRVPAPARETCSAVRSTLVTSPRSSSSRSREKADTSSRPTDGSGTCAPSAIATGSSWWPTRCSPA